MKWILTDIEDVNEDRVHMPGEPDTVIVTVQNEEGEETAFEVSSDWIIFQGLDIGDEWPEDIDEDDQDNNAANMMTEAMERFYDSLDELDEIAECDHTIARAD